MKGKASGRRCIKDYVDGCEGCGCVFSEKDLKGCRFGRCMLCAKAFDRALSTGRCHCRSDLRRPVKRIVYLGGIPTAKVEAMFCKRCLGRI